MPVLPPWKRRLCSSPLPKLFVVKTFQVKLLISLTRELEKRPNPRSRANALESDMSGLAVGTTTSGGEEVARLAPGARVVKGIPPMAELFHSDNPTVNGKQVGLFVAGDDAQAKATVTQLLYVLPVAVTDAGDLTAARFHRTGHDAARSPCLWPGPRAACRFSFRRGRPRMTARLGGSHVVVVGGSSGIGRATAELAVKWGAKVSIASRDPAKLAAAAAEIGAGWASVDTTDTTSVARWAAGLSDVDHLIITASSAVHGRFDTVAIKEVRRMFDAKFFGPYAVTKALLPKMRESGSITFFSGVLSRRPGLDCSGLGAVNAAVEGLTRALALELRTSRTITATIWRVGGGLSYSSTQDGTHRP